jgi:hypothetical protein
MLVKEDLFVLNPEFWIFLIFFIKTTNYSINRKNNPYLVLAHLKVYGL